MHKNDNGGSYNTGYSNYGDFNSGDGNKGNCNSGDCNSGDRNSGYSNSGDRNSGMFNTDSPKMRMFNKDSEYTFAEFRDKFGVREIVLPVSAWVDRRDLTEEEKKSAGGYPGCNRKLGYKESWARGWRDATEEEKDWYRNLPNFDSDIFEEITGIDVGEEVEELTLEAICKELGRNVKIIK